MERNTIFGYTEVRKTSMSRHDGGEREKNMDAKKTKILTSKTLQSEADKLLEKIRHLIDCREKCGGHQLTREQKLSLYRVGNALWKLSDACKAGEPGAKAA